MILTQLFVTAGITAALMTTPETEIPTIVSEREIEEEIRLGDMELVAQMVQAEAGNQSLMGKRLVADVIFNRVDSEKFPDTIEEVLYQNDPYWQFESMTNGRFEEAAWEIDEDSFKAVEMEWGPADTRLDSGILYFSTFPANGEGFYICGNHWFSY